MSDSDDDARAGAAAAARAPSPELGASVAAGAGAGGQPPRDDPLDPASLPALFWDEMPEDPNAHPDFMAMQALAEECTPEERAENFKKQGNKKLEIGIKARNKMLLRDAVKFYGDGLELNSSEREVNVALFNNRAHVHSLLGNWRNALEDAQAALKLEPNNLKAAFRAARAAAKLGRLELAGQLIDAGLALDADNRELKQLQEDLGPARRAAEERRRREAEAEERVMAPARALAAALVARGYRMARPQVGVGDNSRPRLDPDDGQLHWPALLTYPETMASDAVEDWAEGDTVAAHLDVMFGPDAPPLPWDAAGEYTRDRVELYYLANAGTPLTLPQLEAAMAGRWPPGLDRDAEGPKRYGRGAARWARVDETKTLREVCSEEGHVVAGVPLFFVVARGTAYRERFLAHAS